MKEKLIAVVVISLLITAICAGLYKGEHEETFKATAATTEEEEYVEPADMKIGVCIYQFSDQFMSLYKDEIAKKLVEAGFSAENIEIVDSGGSQGYQNIQVKKFIEQGVDILIINPVDTSGLGNITDLAVESHIPLIYINREPDGVEESRWEKNNWKVTYVGCDARQSGILQGNIVVDIGKEKLDKNKDGVIQYVVIRGDKKNIDSYYRSRYSVEAMNEAGWTLECVANRIGNWDRNVSEFIVSRLYAERQDIEVILCNNDSMALGAIDAVKKNGLEPGKDVYIVGVDAVEEAVESVMNGEMAGTVLNNLFVQAHLTASAARAYANGESVPYFNGSEYVKVTSENAASILEDIRSFDE
ncbi:MAG: substrate-binding domain-containing protein [Butyrivibrio sp.]|nr:substrate-binding domain-containing protein [Butyrivibrio sp.]